ncbi:MAG: 16S rRNA (cytidine(1402)-2'-O)-methyltransferase [Actinobacteria bacterium]|nr:MAG: 16S rRNA (cytidine(1402)-2'-O)-methyltransferase [Actinomycetota bacterium]
MDNENLYVQPEGCLLLAATPIGNTRDASQRLCDALAGADIIAAEDTRRARGLAARLKIELSGKLLSLHDHNEEAKADVLLDAVDSGKRVVLVSDAGMPTVSDPGFRVVRRAVERGIWVSALPGPSAPIAALALSGLPSDRFTFEGFVPRKEGDAMRYLGSVSHLPHTLIFFESAQRLNVTLQRMTDVLGGDRQAVVCRELTKTYEETLRGTLTQLVEATSGDIRGEITIVVEGHRERGRAEDHVAAVLALADEGMRLKEAAAQVAKATGLRKNELFAEALKQLDRQ